MTQVRKNALEWVVFGVSLALTLGTLGYLIYEAVTNGAGPPRLEVELGDAERRDGGFAIPVRVRNRGNTTAEQVLVEVVLERDGQTWERAEMQIAFVPRQSEGEGWVTFTHDPEEAERVTPRVLGFEEP